MKIYFASGNAHKRDEMSRIFAPHTIVIPSDEGITFDPEETADSFFGNALIKAQTLYEIVKAPVIADDSGISVDSLNGEPGIHSARYGCENGKNISDSEKNELLISRLKGKEQRSARFICNMILYLEKDRFYSIQETLEGSIIEISKGNAGFGYDPVLLVNGLNKTVAELNPEEKDQISHRGKAGRKLALFLNTQV
ncbi:MAG TPA: RdgB/HAM1 family non-canonical purine NTP pyrophosphatase [Treponemataceae bacterium]|nr:RdgB/HAM1 family non-canonical purine NTP pyrophosphatase [Treponemataceae bacterium]